MSAEQQGGPVSAGPASGTGDDGAPPDPAPPPAPAKPVPAWRARLPRPEIAIAVVGGTIIFVAVNVLLATLSPAEGTGPAPTTSASASALPPASSQAAAAPTPDAGSADAAPTAAADAGAPAAAESDEPDEDTPPTPKPPRDKDKDKDTKPHTVQWAAERACSTAHVDGLSRQIIEESRCLEANAFSRVPHRKNLSSDGHVFLFLDAPARDHLLKALDSHPKQTMKVHSALRTVAQQYLLYRWAAGKRCGIQLANHPGESNHETGLSLDISEPGTWKPALESEGFRWLGAIDRVHFDYVGAGATHHDGLDVRAFQRLWNRNHPDDALAETGHYDKATEQRLKKSPAGGFPTGARCGGGGSDRRVASPARRR